NDDTRFRLGGCIVLLPAGGPEILADGNHVSVGATGASIDGTGRIVGTADGSISPVLWGIVTPDESLAADGVICGASVGFDQTVITVYRNGSVLDLSDPADYAQISGDSANLWVSWAAPVYRGTGEPSLAQQAL